MKLYVEEKLLSIHDKFYVKDEQGVDVYEISSKVISIGAKTTISDMQGNIIAYIEQDILHLMPNYNIYINDKLEFTISKEFQLIKNDYSISNGYRVNGDFMMLNFEIFDDNNNVIGSITRKFFSIGDKYEINIDNPIYKEIVLAIIVAIKTDVNRNQNSQ